jgi:hypothetical protein
VQKHKVNRIAKTEGGASESGSACLITGASGNGRKKEAKRVMRLDPTQDARWDGFVEKHSLGWVCHLSGWKTVLEKSFKHIKGYYFVITDNGGESIRAALPVFDVKSWLTGSRLVSVPFATLFDPLVSSAEDMALFVDELIRLSGELKCSYVEIRTFQGGRLIKSNQLGESRYFKHHYLTLDSPPDQLRCGFHRTCVRQRISRAEKSDIRLKIGQDESDLMEFYKLQLLTRKRLSLPVQPYRFFKHLWDVFHPPDQLILLLAQKNGHFLAGLMLFAFNGRVSAEFAASDETYKEFSPNHFLFWEAIKMAYEKGCNVFDFGRTSPNNTSLMDFKSRWGCDMIDLAHFYYPGHITNEMGSREESWKYKFAANVCGGAPDALQKTIGHFCYRHLG